MDSVSNKVALTLYYRVYNILKSVMYIYIYICVNLAAMPECPQCGTIKDNSILNTPIYILSTHSRC